MINWERVSELKAEFEAEDFREIVEIFLEEVTDVLLRLAREDVNSAHEGNFHFLKGSALNLGFKEFSEICGEAEENARNGNLVAIDILKLRKLFDQSLSEFRTRAEELGLAA